MPMGTFAGEVYFDDFDDFADFSDDEEFDNEG